jgi:hypothetical protein
VQIGHDVALACGDEHGHVDRRGIGGDIDRA